MNAIFIEGTFDQLMDVVDLLGVNNVRRMIRPAGGLRWQADARADDAMIPQIESLGCAVTVVAPPAVTALLPAASAYPDAATITSRLQSLKTTYAPVCSLLGPTQTQRGRDLHVLSIAGQGPIQKTVMIVGGFHAREWAPPSAVLSCFEALMKAYPGKDARAGKYVLRAADVKEIVDKLQIYGIPLVNPDGYDYSRTPAGRNWRKNDFPTGSNVGKGVDLGRNFDILWKYEVAYKENVVWKSAGGFKVPLRLSISDNPDDELYRGPNPVSEKETLLVHDLIILEDVEYFLDIHSYGRYLMHPWAIETNTTASSKSTMNFNNSFWDGKRDGKTRSPEPTVYEEYIEGADADEMRKVGRAMKRAISRANGETYSVGTPANLLYCAPASSIDWAYSRHRDITNAKKVWSFAIECGHETENEFAPTAKQYPKIETEVHAAIFAFLRYIATGQTYG